MQIKQKYAIRLLEKGQEMCINQINTIIAKLQWKYNLHISVHCITLHTYLLSPNDPPKKK